MDAISELRYRLKSFLQICKTDASTPECGGNTTTVPLATWNDGQIGDTLKAVVLEAEKRGLGDRAEAVLLRFFEPLPEPIPAIEEAMRFVERLDAMKPAAIEPTESAIEQGDDSGVADAPNVSSNEGKGVAPRNDWLLRQYEDKGTDTYHKPAKVFAKWDIMTNEDRAGICPDSPNKVSKATVAKSIKRAQAARDGKPAKRKRAPRKKP